MINSWEVACLYDQIGGKTLGCEIKYEKKQKSNQKLGLWRCRCINFNYWKFKLWRKIVLYVSISFTASEIERKYDEIRF